MSFFLKKNIIWVCLLSMWVGSLHAQNEIKNIEETYRYVISNIERREYLVNEFKINANRFSLHQPGYFQYFEKYYYLFDKREQNVQRPLIQAIILRTEKNNINFYQEYIFDKNGDFVYYYELQIPNEKSIPSQRLKLYFQQNKMLKWIEENKEIIDHTEQSQRKVQQIIASAKEYKLKFDEQFKEVSWR